MIRFDSDYVEGCHPQILQMLIDSNMEQHIGYGHDVHSTAARDLIRSAIHDASAAIHFVSGGTQANRIILDAILRPYETVLCAASGHIYAHEAGAIESTGHKITAIPDTDGKVTADVLENYLAEYWRDGGEAHLLQPRVLYISDSTEIGTIYSSDELSRLSAVCRRYGVYLMLDGARLAYALACPENDLTLPMIAQLTDIFYIGGTKVGALLGEAIVITNDALKPNFHYVIKQHGATLAKGRVMGIQFEYLFTDNHYIQAARPAIESAVRIRSALTQRGIPLAYPSPTNQLFPILTREQLERLSSDFALSHIAYLSDDRHIVRICTGWATSAENTDKLIDAIAQLI